MKLSVPARQVDPSTHLHERIEAVTAPITWRHTATEPLNEDNLGMVVVGKDRFGYGVIGILVLENLTLMIREISSRAASVNDIPADWVHTYTLLQPMPECGDGQGPHTESLK